MEREGGTAGTALLDRGRAHPGDPAERREAAHPAARSTGPADQAQLGTAPADGAPRPAAGQRTAADPAADKPAPAAERPSAPPQGDAPADGRASDAGPGAGLSDRGPRDRGSRKRPRCADEDRRRGQRMLGMLNATLARAGAKRQRGEAPETPLRSAPGAERPAGSSPGDDYRRERAEHDAERAAVRTDVQRVRALAAQLAEQELAHRTARSSKRRLSSFLVTHGGRRRARPSRDAAEDAARAPALAQDAVPVVLAYGGMRSAEHEVYYLPRRLLPEQERALDEQEELVDDALDRADDLWERERDAVQQELTQVKERLQRHGVAWR